MKILSLLILLAAAPAAAAPAAGQCATAAQDGYKAARDTAAGQVSAANGQVETLRAQVQQLQLQFIQLNAQPQWKDPPSEVDHKPAASPLLSTALEKLSAQLDVIANGGSGYLTAAGADMAGSVLSARHAALSGAGTTGAGSVTGAATALRAQVGPLSGVAGNAAAKGLAASIKSALNEAAAIADRSSLALNDAVRQHGLMGNCATQQETAMNSEQENLDKKDKKDGGGGGMPSPPSQNPNQDKKPLPEKKKVNIVRNSNDGVYMGSIAPEGNQPRPATFSSQPIGLTQR